MGETHRRNAPTGGFQAPYKRSITLPQLSQDIS
jgi:hypothetical protein